MSSDLPAKILSLSSAETQRFIGSSFSFSSADQDRLRGNPGKLKRSPQQYTRRDDLQDSRIIGMILDFQNLKQKKFVNFNITVQSNKFQYNAGRHRQPESEKEKRRERERRKPNLLLQV